MAGSKGRVSGRERVLDAAYGLFTRYGVQAVGVDTIVEEAGVAKATLYRNFKSKDELALAVLERREERWTNEWLRADVYARADTPAQRLLAVFDVFGEWFATPDFEGCTFINVMLELTQKDDSVRQASVQQLSNIREFLAGLAADAGVEDSEAFARQWHILMKGSIVAAAEGDTHAGARARELGTLLLARHGIVP